MYRWAVIQTHVTLLFPVFTLQHNTPDIVSPNSIRVDIIPYNIVSPTTKLPNKIIPIIAPQTITPPSPGHATLLHSQT